MLVFEDLLGLGEVEQVLGKHLPRQAEHPLEVGAHQMAIGVRAKLDADIGISVTGIAGPDGATPQKPVGLVFMGFANPRGEVTVKRFEFRGNRMDIKEQTCRAALEWLLAYLKE